MFDLGTLRVIRRDDPLTRSWSFVGVRRSPDDGHPEFWLPHGFHDFPSGNYDVVVNTFFQLYRIMRVYAANRELRDDTNERKREAFRFSNSGLEYEQNNAEPIPTFAKMNLLEEILDSFDEIVISSVLTKQASRPPQSYEEIHRHLHHAVYLPDDVIYLESQPANRQEIESVATELVQMFCYVYRELALRLDEGKRITLSVAAYADAFKQDWLPDSWGLFSANAYQLTISVLRERLDAVFRATPYKDEDFWSLFRALEVFLYGDVRQDDAADGIVCGISDYYPIWEDMCHVYCWEWFSGREADVQFADSPRHANTTAGRRRIRSAFGDATPFRLELNGARRFLAPDFVAVVDPAKQSPVRHLERTLFEVKREEGKKGLYRGVSVKVYHLSDTTVGWLRGLDRKIKGGYQRGSDVRQGVLVFQAIPRTVFERALLALALEWRRPDQDLECFIQDFKYMHPSEFFTSSPGKKLRSDIAKQAAYHLALQFQLDASDTRGHRITSQFLIPLYDAAASEDYYVLNNDRSRAGCGVDLCQTMQDSKIDLVGLSFQKVAAVYLVQG